MTVSLTTVEFAPGADGGTRLVLTEQGAYLEAVNLRGNPHVLLLTGCHRWDDGLGVTSLTLVDPVSPFGFGGTRGVDGILCDPWGAGTGGGAANPEFVERLAGKDRTDLSPLSPRQVLLAHYVKPPHVPEHLDIFVESMLSTRTGEWWYPGGGGPLGVRAGDRGVLNTMARPTSGSRPVRVEPAGALGARRQRRHRLRHLPVRPGLPGLARRDPRLAR